MAELIVTVSADGELTVRSEGLTRAQWDQATAELRGVLGEPTGMAHPALSGRVCSVRRPDGVAAELS